MARVVAYAELGWPMPQADADYVRLQALAVELAYLTPVPEESSD